MDISIKGLSKVSILKILDQKIELYERKISILKQAKALLEDTELALADDLRDEIKQAQPEPPPSVPDPAPKVDLAPKCSACDKGRMRPAVTRAPSGVYIQMLRCDDGACNNEAY